MKKQNHNEVLDLIVESNGKMTLTPLLPITLANASDYEDKLSKIEYTGNSELFVDLGNIIEFDSYLVAFYNQVHKFASEHNIKVDFINGSKEQENLVSVFTKKRSVAQPEHKPSRSLFYSYIETIGKKIRVMLSDAYDFTEFMGNLFTALIKLPVKINEIRFKDFAFFFNSAGVNAVPITLLIIFLLGFIMGYQGAWLLKQFGADKYIADLVGIVLARELAPLMTAILVAGRSGSAFAAEIGTMKVSEEIDAIKTMGIDLYQFIILPRVLAVSLAIPFVTILADLAGVVGGYVAASFALKMTLTGYITELTRALNYSHVFSGVGKSIVFGFLVAAVGCFRGLQASGGAESVGKFTTAAVVTGVLFIILSDAVFTFLFQTLGI